MLLEWAVKWRAAELWRAASELERAAELWLVTTEFERAGALQFKVSRLGRGCFDAMPNGHGGVPYFGGPIFFAMLFAIFAWLPFGDEGWFAWVRIGICIIFATAIGWRIAYYVHMYDADDYGGAYTPPDVYKRASRRYWIAVPFYALVTAAAGFGVLWWRGLLDSMQ